MVSTMPFGFSRSGAVLSCVSMALLTALAIAQEDESGASAGRTFELGVWTSSPAEFDDAYCPIDVERFPASDGVEVRDTATEREPPGPPRLLWEQLAGLDQTQRANAEIEIELGSRPSGAARDEGLRIANLWNSGEYDAALEHLRALRA